MCYDFKHKVKPDKDGLITSFYPFWKSLKRTFHCRRKAQYFPNYIIILHNCEKFESDEQYTREEEYEHRRKFSVISDENKDIVIQKSPLDNVEQKPLRIIEEEDPFIIDEDESQNSLSNKDNTSSIELLEENKLLIQYYFNPPDETTKEHWCKQMNYSCGILSKIVFNNHNLVNNKFDVQHFKISPCSHHPNKIQTIYDDGNCGFRALSYALTGIEENHKKIRWDIMEYLSLNIDLYLSDIADNNNKWFRKLYYDIFKNLLAYTKQLK